MASTRNHDGGPTTEEPMISGPTSTIAATIIRAAVQPPPHPSKPSAAIGIYIGILCVIIVVVYRMNLVVIRTVRTYYIEMKEEAEFKI
ncbi:unnamed protein product [Linum trigynum]|uniref:Uncharacterized protein n=1 Tax=Linum trigynum TaxID=586398 RepID=A0AAV2EKF1_9ROSI